MVTIACITIGQSPRDDVVPEIRDGLSSRFEIVQAGALDSYESPSEVEAAAGPKEGEPILVTQLRDGQSVRVGRRAIADHVQRVIADLEEEVDAFGVLCTGDFRPFEASVPVLDPGHLVYGWASAIAPHGTIGILMPDQEQEAQVKEKWSGLDVVTAVGSPYKPEDDLRAAARKLNDEDVDLFVLDCMGSTKRMKEIVLSETGTSVLLPSSILTKTFTEIL